MHTKILAGLLGTLLGAAGAVAAGAEAGGREIPEPFAPLEHLIGSWKGQGIPTANRLKGWPEKHLWAWKFSKGVPVGMSLTLEGDRALARAELTCDGVGKPYRLEGTDPEGKPVAYVGTFAGASSSKMLTLDRVGESAGGGKERLTLWPNSNGIRYALWLDRREPGAPQYKRVIEVGLTKEGEAFAAGGSAADLPKCVITGGAATMTISYRGKSYPICCSGCRDEFNDNPEKYVKKAALRAEKGATSPVKPASSGVARDDGAFAGFGDDAAPRSKPAPRPDSPKPAPAPASPSAADLGPTGATKADAAAAKHKDEARAASLLRLGQNLEKSGKPAAALPYYRRVVKEHAGSVAAKAAAARIKALGGD